MLKKVKKDKMDKMVKKVTWSDDVIVHNIVKKDDKKNGPPPMGPRPPVVPPPPHLLIDPLPAQTTNMGPRPPLVPPPAHLLIPVIARSASSRSGLSNCCFAVTRLWGQSQVGHSYRHLKWLWSIQCPVYLFMDARQQLPAAAAWLNTFLNLLPYKDHAMRLPIV